MYHDLVLLVDVHRGGRRDQRGGRRGAGAPSNSNSNNFNSNSTSNSKIVIAIVVVILIVVLVVIVVVRPRTLRDLPLELLELLSEPESMSMAFASRLRTALVTSTPSAWVTSTPSSAPGRAESGPSRLTAAAPPTKVASSSRSSTTSSTLRSCVGAMASPALTAAMAPRRRAFREAPSP